MIPLFEYNMIVQKPEESDTIGLSIPSIAEKTELREEKLTLKADKEKMEQQSRAVAVPPPRFMPTYPAAYHAAANKMPVFPSYGLMPMWRYLPPAACDISRDHELRPPAA
ncbi:hypothetical protein POTOM_032031 [Populus tomentosa]|uniref:Uncharacterized protein n=1 Tax=Populus tomentosa TaxID=118781 RepID=A0A8X8CSF4_POPTO|nr:hypothetical protein POTOM_032031 [Populus tomentosa]